MDLPPTPSTSMPDGTPRPGSRRVLVAEDNAISRMLIGHQLRALGCDPVCTEDGERAAAAWRSEPFAMLLTDLQMPGMDGFGLAALVRNETVRVRMPIVALTAGASAAEADHCRAVGIDDCLSKPIALEALAAVLDKWLGATVSETP